jgi:hypothetical protein
MDWTTGATLDLGRADADPPPQPESIPRTAAEKRNGITRIQGRIVASAQGLFVFAPKIAVVESVIRDRNSNLITPFQANVGIARKGIGMGEMGRSLAITSFGIKHGDWAGRVKNPSQNESDMQTSVQVEVVSPGPR